MGKPLDFNPGTAYAYSNFGYCVLGRVIEAVSGKPYHEVRAREDSRPRWAFAACGWARTSSRTARPAK